MATFNYHFNLSVVVPKRQRSKSDNLPAKVQKLLGTIMMDIDARYYVKVHKRIETLNENKEVIKVDDSIETYDISQNSFTCKGKEVVWRMEEKGFRFIQWIRRTNSLIHLPYYWKPFKPGVIVRGYINSAGKFEILKVHYAYIEELDKREFTSKISFVDFQFVDEAKKFYLNNYETIKKNFELKYKPIDE